MTWNTPESDEEREAREAREAELQAERDRQEAERKVAREKMTILSEMRSALDVYTRVMRWSTEHYSRPMDYTPEKQAEELEIAAWRIQGQGELMREHMPELFWPRGTPVRAGSGIYVKPGKLKALKLDLEATAETIDDLLSDPVEQEDDEAE